MMRLSIIFDNFGPYHVARVGALAGRMKVTGIELRARSKTYGWKGADEQGIHKVTLPEVAGLGAAARNELSRHLEEALTESRPDVVAVNGWGDFMAPQGIRWCVTNRVPFVLMSESSALNGPRSAPRDAIKRRLVRLASAALVGGIPHREHVIDLGLPEARVFTGYNAVDNDYFANKTADFKIEDRRSENRGQETEGIHAQDPNIQYPISNIHFPYFLASNRFIERKNLLRLIEAYARYARSDQGSGITNQEEQSTIHNPRSTIWNLCLLGDGEQKPTLIDLCHQLGLNVIESAPWESCRNTEKPKHRNTVFFPGFRQIEELPRFYAQAGCFIHPAMNEPWGLVVNEAMASGLPVLISDHVGCAQDLVNDGVNGFVFDPEDTRNLARLMAKVAAPGFPLVEFGEAGARLIKRHGPAGFADGLQSAAKTALQAGPVNVSLVDRLLLNLLCHLR